MRARLFDLVAIFAIAGNGCGSVERTESDIDGVLAASPNLAGNPGEISLRFALENADDTALIEQIDMRRADGFDPPPTCDDGDAAGTLAGPTSAIVDTIVERHRRVHSYRACVRTVSGAVRTTDSMTAVGVLYNNPGPGCLAPPCDQPQAGAPSSGTFAAGAPLASTASIRGDAILVDLDSDGSLDVVIAAFAINRVHLGAGDGSFGPAAPASARALESAAAVAGDFNNDGTIDVVFANANGPSYLQLGDGTGALSEGSAVYAGIFPEVFDVEAADFNGDDNLDLIVARFKAADLIYLGDGAGNFTFLRELPPADGESCINCLTVGDVDGDRKTDVVVAYNMGDQRIHVFRGLGDDAATFDAPISVSYGDVTPIAVRLADFNNDGDLDIAVGESLAGGVHVSTGDGSGSFSPLAEVAATTVSRIYGLGVGDFNGDGNADITFSQDTTGPIGFLAGLGDGNFGPQGTVSGQAVYSSSNVDVGDVNGDGRLDILVGVGDAASVVFEGQP